MIKGSWLAWIPGLLLVVALGTIPAMAQGTDPALDPGVQQNGSGLPEAIGPSEVERVPRILVLGDSLSAGYGLKLERGWVSLLQQRLRDSGRPERVINASISGETTAGGEARLASLLDSHQPTVVILELGANDGLRGFSLSRIQAALARLIETARAADARVLLLGVRLPPNYGAAYSQGFQQLFEHLGEQLDVAVVPRMLAGVAEDRGLMQPDGLHPVAEAQPLILDTVWPALLPLLD